MLLVFRVKKAVSQQFNVSHFCFLGGWNCLTCSYWYFLWAPPDSGSAPPLYDQTALSAAVTVCYLENSWCYNQLPHLICQHYPLDFSVFVKGKLMTGHICLMQPLISACLMDWILNIATLVLKADHKPRQGQLKASVSWKLYILASTLCATVTYIRCRVDFHVHGGGEKSVLQCCKWIPSRLEDIRSPHGKIT